MIPSRGCSPGDPGATLHAYVHHTTPGGIRLLGRIALNSPEGCLPSSSVRVNSEPVILMCTSQSLHHPPAGARASQNLLTGGFLPQASQRLLLLVWLTGVLTGLQQLCAQAQAHSAGRSSSAHGRRHRCRRHLVWRVVRSRFSHRQGLRASAWRGRFS